MIDAKRRKKVVRINRTPEDNFVDQYVGSRIRKRRRELGMTQEELGAHLEVEFQRIQRYECGAISVRANQLRKLAKALRVSTDYFFKDMPPFEEN